MNKMENAQLLVLLTVVCLILASVLSFVTKQAGAVQAQLIHLTDMFGGGALAVLVPRMMNGNGNGNGNGSAGK